MSEPADWPTRDPLAHRVAATPTRTAVVDTDAGREWSYREFDRLVATARARLEATLKTAQPAPRRSERRVATLISTRVGFVTAFYATLRSGAQIVPLNVRLTERELASRLDRIDPALLLCEAATEQSAVAVGDCPIRSLDPPESESVTHLQSGTAASDTGDPAEWDRHETALVMFTSGTTGDPKGVRLTLGNLVASATASAFRLGVSPSDRWLCCLPVYHMGGLAPLLRCPLYGTALLLQTEFDADGTAGALAEHEATGVSLVPTQLTRMLDAGWRPPRRLDSVLLGGAPARRELVERALDLGVPVFPTYGLTEAASQVATATPGTARSAPGTVGEPLVVTDLRVVDADGTTLDRGETGELVVDGPTVTPGYLDEDRTESAFSEHGLHTRDVGYVDGDGRLWVLGRADDTIVTGGENVHPREVVDVLRDHPAVEDAAVVGLSDEEWGQRVGALIVGDAEPAAVEPFVRDRLAGYKLPKTWATVPELPRTPSGTVDREAVRERLGGA